jgi:hypothetical protein
MEDLTGSSMFWLKGGGGTGKTAWLAKVCEMLGALVAARHLCRHNDARLSDPARMLRSLAAQLLESVPGYKEQLQALPEADLLNLARMETDVQVRWLCCECCDCGRVQMCVLL